MRPVESGALPGWVERALAEKKGEDVGVVFSTSDYAVGRNRVGFLVVRGNAELVQAPEAEVRVAREGSATPASVRAELVPLEPHEHGHGEGPHDHIDATDLYVAYVETPKPGRYWLVVDLAGESIQGIGSLDVKEKPATPAIGSKAVASDTPTLADAPLAKLTTATPPARELVRYSVAESLAAGKPFVLVFATPKYCESRTCGPTVEVVDKARQEFAARGIRFIHVEIYEDNDPDKGVNRWVKEWNLPTEPWVFVVDGEGVIRAKFEGSVSEEEVERAIREHLL